VPLPTLTWHQRFLGSVSDGNDPVTVLTALRDYLATSVSPSFKWTVTADGVSNTESGGSVAAPYLELTSAANVGANPIKILIAGSDSSSFPTNDSFYGGNSGIGDYKPSLSRQNSIVIGIAPDGGTLNGPHTQANPYGSARWSGYVKLHEPLTATQIDNLWVVDSAEVIAILTQGSDNLIRGVIAGACIAPLSDNAGETQHGGVGRTYGIVTIHAGLGFRNYWRKNPPTANFLSPQSNNGNNTDGKGGQGISLCWDPDGGGLAHFAYYHVVPTQTNTGTTIFPGALLDSVGNYATIPIPLVNRSTTTYQQTRMIGVMRQVKYAATSRCRAVFQDSTGNDVGFVVSTTLTADGEAFAFTNS